jgi:hypothetical protein
MPQSVRCSAPTSRRPRSFVRRAIGLAAGVALAATALPAQVVIASSSFTTNAEGWTLGDLFGRPCTPSTGLTHLGSGGNPGGFIRTIDACSNVTAFIAPSAYLGNRLDAVGGELRFSMRSRALTQGVSDLVVLTGGGLSIGVTTGTRPGAPAWTNFVVPMSVGSWRLVTNATLGATATEQQFLAVLGSLTAMRLQADWVSGGDETDLDSVSLTGVAVPPPNVVPEPSTYVLLASGLAGLGVIARRRRA